MKSEATEAFWLHYRQLPAAVRDAARKAYRQWLANPFHPGLSFRPIAGKREVYTIRIGIHWRALGLRKGNTITWFWIGSHAEYDEMLRRL